MIIYEDEELVIPSGIGPAINTETGQAILQKKTVEISKNGTTVVVPGLGFDGLSECDIITNVPTQINNQEKTVTFTENGEYAVTPDLRYTGMDRVNVTVNLPDPPLQEKTVDSSNNSQEVVADSSYYGLSKVNINPIKGQTKTIDSSTSSQTVTADANYDALSAVTVNPYVLDSKTVDSSTVVQEVYSDVDGLNKVTVEPYELDEKTVDSSTNEQIVTSDVDGLSKVTVTPYILDEKTVDSSTKSQVVTSDADGLSKVTINPYVLDSLEVDSSTANQEFTGQYGTVTVNKYVLDSKTVDSSTKSQVVTSSVDGLKQVTVNPYVLDSKTVDSSTVRQEVTSNVNGLSKVTINPYVLDSKTVDPSTNQQIVTSDEDGLSSVTVTPISLNQYTVSPKYVFSPSQAGEVAYTDPSSGYIGFSRIGQYKCYRGSMTLDVSTNDVTYSKSDYFQAPPYNLSPTNAAFNTDVYSVKINKVTSAIDSNIQPQNIVDGVSILGVQGTFALQEKTVDSSTELQVLSPESGYNGFSSVTVNPYYTNLQDKTIDSSTSVQTISYDSSYGGLNSVTINPLPLERLYLSGPWIEALAPSRPVTDIVGYTYQTVQAPFTPVFYYPTDGYHAFSQVGISKAMINIGYEFQPRTEDVVYDVSKWPWSTPVGLIGGVEWDESAERIDTRLVGVNNFTIKAVDASIDANIQPENIKPGVTILGVQGTYVPDLEDKMTYWYPAYYTDTDTDSSIKFNPDEPYIGMSSITIWKVPIKNSLEITPSTQQQEFDSSVMYTRIQGFRNVTVKAVDASIDANIQAGNIKSGVSILGVQGTFEGGTLQTMTVDSSTSSQLFTPTQGNYGIGSITVNPYVLDSKTVDSSTVVQEVYSDVDGLASVTINPYVLDSKTVDSSTVSQTVVSSEDGLSSVTINPYVLDSKTVDSSTVSQTITSDEDGLSSVTINPYVLDSKTVDSSTVAQTIVSDADGLSQVVINPYVLDNLTLNSSTNTQNVEGQYGNVTVNPYTLDSKTVDSSTVSQTITSDEDGLSSVTINPYVLDSKTVDSSTVSQEIISDEDGLSKVTINPYVLDSKTVDSSTVVQTVVSDEDGLSSVTVNPYVLDSKTVDSSTVSQTITSDEDGLASVTINPYVLDSKTVDSSTVTQVITSEEDGLSQVTINPYVLGSLAVNSSTAVQEFTGQYGTVTVSPYVLDSSTVDSSTSTQTLIGQFGEVTINPYVLDTSTLVTTQNGEFVITSSADGLSRVDVSVNIDTQAYYNSGYSAGEADGIIEGAAEQKAKLDSSVFTSNGIFTREDGWNKVTIEVPSDIHNQSKTADSSTNSQIITADSNYSGLGQVTINPYVLDSKTVDSSTVAQTILSSEDGLSSVIINPYVLDSSTLEITTNGQYAVVSTADGLSRVDVSVGIDTQSYYDSGYSAGETVGIAEGIAQQKALLDSSTFTANATYTRADGWNEITVEVPIPTFTTQSKTVDSSTNSQEVEPNSGYDGLSKVTVNPYVLDSSTVDPSTNQITVTSAEDGLSSVIVNAVTSSIDANIAAGNIKDGVTILGVQGTYVGTVINNQNKPIDSSTAAQTVTYDSGYTGLGTVTITALNLDSIYNTLAAY